MIERIGVIGAGQMGNGIAHVCAMAGLDVRLIDLAQDQLDAAAIAMRKNMDRQMRRGLIDEVQLEEALVRILPSTDLSVLGDCDMVIEAATEDEVIKGKIYQSIIPHLRDDTIIATNTSSIPITRLATTTDRAGLFIGMHFMNPVPMMQLVEVIRGIATDDETVSTVQELSLIHI